VPPDARQRQALEQLEISQALRQQQLQLHQQRALAARPDAPSDDEGVRHAKAQIDQQRARQESRQQLQQFDRELQSKVDAGRVSRGFEEGAFARSSRRTPDAMQRGGLDEWRLPGAGTGGPATGLMAPSP
jgi:hypothetical protein